MGVTHLLSALVEFPDSLTNSFIICSLQLFPPLPTTLQATSGANDLGRNANECRGAQPWVEVITFPLDAVSALLVWQMTWKCRVSACKCAQASWSLHWRPLGVPGSLITCSPRGGDLNTGAPSEGTLGPPQPVLMPVDRAPPPALCP